MYTRPKLYIASDLLLEHKKVGVKLIAGYFLGIHRMFKTKHFICFLETTEGRVGIFIDSKLRRKFKTSHVGRWTIIYTTDKDLSVNFSKTNTLEL